MLATLQQGVRKNLIPQRPGPATDSIARGTGFGIPADLLGKARKRLASLSLALAILFVATTALTVTSQLIDGASVAVPMVDVVLAVLAVGAFAIARFSAVPHHVVFELGLAAQVVICFAISFGNVATMLRQHGHVPYLTFASIIIVIFPLVVPSPPLWTLLAALASAATAPLALLLIEQIHEVPLSPANYFTVSVGPVLCAGFAFFASRVVYGISLEVSKARRMGSYELVSSLGRGGMGEVWRARHRFLARPAALKLIRVEALSSAETAQTVRQRFEREAQATAGMRSAHTISVYDFGVTDDGTFYYVMELLDGLDLETLVETHGPLPASRVVHLLRQACDSLAEAHEAGLIHRDIKPANLHVSRYGRHYDFVKVLDFGLVRAIQEESQDPGLTKEGTVAGTPAYMAPEVARGEGEVDHRMDIYALGCVSYWLLTGQRVFDAPSSMKMVIMHATETPELPSTRTELDIPGDLEEVVMACLAKDPADRPQSADDLASRLERCSVEAWDQQQARAWWELHRPKGSSIDTSS